MKMPVTGGTPTTVATMQAAPFAIAADGTRLYWSKFMPPIIQSMPLAGGPIQTLASDQFALSLFVRDGKVYWSDTQITLGFSQIFAVPGDGSRAPVPLAQTPGSDAVVTDGVNLYWTDEVSQTVRKAPVAGGEPTVLATDQITPTEIAIDGTNIYWIDSIRLGTVMKLAK